jgi:hypothetical protein
VNAKFAVAAAVFVSSTSVLHCQDPKSGAENMKYSRDAYSKVHMVAIAKLTFEAPPAAEFKYDRYPNGGPERIQSGEGVDFARKDGKTWLKSQDWGEMGEPVDAQIAKRLNNWISVIDNRLNSDAPLKFVKKEDAGERNEFVFQEVGKKGKGAAPRFVFGQYKNAKDTDPPILDHYSGPMQLGMHEAKVDIKFSYLVSVQIQDVTEKSSSPAPSPANAVATSPPPAKTEPQTGGTVSLLDGKFKIDIPPDFKREADDPKEPKTLAKFAREDGAWGTVLRGTHGLTPDQLDGYIKMRVGEYSKGFKWLPKDAHLQWLHKEVVTINGWKWADWSFVPMLKGKKDYRNSPVYSRNLTASYKGQLLEINFTTNLTTDPALKDEIDKIMASVHLEE